MEAGLFTNLFRVDFIENQIELMQVERAKYSDLLTLRKELPDCTVYADGDKIYGYGQNKEALAIKSFETVNIDLNDNPRLATRIITESICDYLSNKGYEISFDKYSNKIFDRNHPISLSLSVVKLYPVFEFKTIFLRDLLTQSLVYGIVLDSRFEQTINDERASHNKIRKEIIAKYSVDTANNIMQEIKIKVGDLTPNRRRNEEASRDKLNKIISFINGFDDYIPSRVGINLAIDKNLTRIVMEGENG